LRKKPLPGVGRGREEGMVSRRGLGDMEGEGPQGVFMAKVERSVLKDHGGGWGVWEKGLASYPKTSLHRRV